MLTATEKIDYLIDLGREYIFENESEKNNVSARFAATAETKK